MKVNILFKSLLTLTFLTISYPNICTRVTRDCNYKSYIFQDFDVVSDAIDGIQKALNQEKHKPYFIRRTYDISRHTVCVTTKSHYTQYRKKPKYRKMVFDANIFSLLDNESEKIEFVYKNSDKKHITQINKKVKNRNFKTKKIVFNINPIQAKTILKV